MNHYTRFGIMIGTSTVVMMGLMYLNTFQLDQVYFSETRSSPSNQPATGRYTPRFGDAPVQPDGSLPPVERRAPRSLRSSFDRFKN